MISFQMALLCWCWPLSILTLYPSGMIFVCIFWTVSLRNYYTFSVIYLWSVHSNDSSKKKNKQMLSFVWSVNRLCVKYGLSPFQFTNWSWVLFPMHCCCCCSFFFFFALQSLSQVPLFPPKLLVFFCVCILVDLLMCFHPNFNHWIRFSQDLLSYSMHIPQNN